MDFHNWLGSRCIKLLGRLIITPCDITFTGAAHVDRFL